MNADRNTYSEKALKQIPRLLSCLDRNAYSSTYGSFHRDYWHDKATDYSDADRQFGVHALALIYTYDFPGSPFKGQAKIRDWAIAAMDFWSGQQHSDGSFDEHYPQERGWAGPTAFSTYTCCEAYLLLANEIPEETGARIKSAIGRAARFLAKGESEKDDLANHHAIASLAVWKAYEVLNDPELKEGYEKLLSGFLRYHNSEEGWSREYDGADPGYLSATISFLAKIYEKNPDPRLLEVLESSIEFCSYFVYPNGSYAGSLGSRNTLHFYPHGFEILAKTHPLASAVAEKMLAALEDNQLVPPEIMSDHYMAYRLPEYLLAYQAYVARPSSLTPLPYEREPFTRYFPKARIAIANRKRYYAIANLAKGGVVKVFDRKKNSLPMNDSGILARLGDERLVTSQWINPDYEITGDPLQWSVSGRLQGVPQGKRFTPFTFLLFRTTLFLFGRWPSFSHWLKGRIRKVLILGARPAAITFRRTFAADDAKITLTDQILLNRGAHVQELSVGDDFSVRHVPQSRYFQKSDLDDTLTRLNAAQLEALHKDKRFTLKRELLFTEE